MDEVQFDEIDRLCARRAQEALSKYGILRLLDDPRDFVDELREELLDAINYTRWAEVKGRIARCHQLYPMGRGQGENPPRHG